MRYLLYSLLCVGLAAGCSRAGKTVLGSAPQGAVGSIASVRSTEASRLVTVRGTLVEKCPVAGCWFNLRDKTGVIKVDTKTAGFVVLDVPLRTTLLVSGRVASSGSEKIIEATGVRY
ncbi:MAG: single stranded DNA-binding domain-containing protein [Limisphaerales bacterium]